MKTNYRVMSSYDPEEDIVAIRISGNSIALQIECYNDDDGTEYIYCVERKNDEVLNRHLLSHGALEEKA
jgi:hypothetical protein